MRSICSSTSLSLSALLLVGASLLGCTQNAPETDPVMDASFWKQQGLNDILPAWTRHAQTADGLYYAELGRDWTPEDSTNQYPGMVGRHVFSYVAGYLLSGEEAHLRRAETALDFMIDHGWDKKHGGWYNAVTRSGTVVDEDKDLFMQIYATMGVALYALATKDSTAQGYVERSRRFMQKHAWDAEHGGYVGSRSGRLSLKIRRTDRTEVAAVGRSIPATELRHTRVTASGFIRTDGVFPGHAGLLVPPGGRTHYGPDADPHAERRGVGAGTVRTGLDLPAERRQEQPPQRGSQSGGGLAAVATACPHRKDTRETDPLCDPSARACRKAFQATHRPPW